jgi:hypothetical protein
MQSLTVIRLMMLHNVTSFLDLKERRGTWDLMGVMDELVVGDPLVSKDPRGTQDLVGQLEK